MPLNWIVEEKNADYGTYIPPKDVMLEGSGMNNVPKVFEIFRYHDSAIRQVMKHVGIPELVPVSAVTVIPGGPGKFISERPWNLPVPRKSLKKSAGFLFLADSADEKSGVIYSTRKARAQIAKKQKGKLGTPPLPHVPATVGAEFERVVSFEVIFAVDPEMEVSVLTGQDLAAYVLATLREEGGDDPDVQARISLEAGKIENELPETYRPPSDWHLETPTTVSGDPGHTSTINVTVSAPSVGLGYFALLLSDPEAREDDEVSSIFAVEVAREENGVRLSLISDFDSIPLPQPVYA